MVSERGLVKAPWRSQRGSSLAWAAVFMGFVLLPLMGLVGDGARLYYVRNRLDTATQAACESAAWSAGGRIGWQQQGATSFSNNLELFSLAVNTFYQMQPDRAKVPYSASISVVVDNANARLNCTGVATVPLSVNASQRRITITSQASARLRFAR